MPDEVGGAARAVEHLLSIGRRRIAHVTGPEHHHSAQIRAAGAAARLADDGLDFAVPPLFGEWSEGWDMAEAGTKQRVRLAAARSEGCYGDFAVKVRIRIEP